VRAMQVMLGREGQQSIRARIARPARDAALPDWPNGSLRWPEVTHPKLKQRQSETSCG
jgi:hypothetical protein